MAQPGAVRSWVRAPDNVSHPDHPRLRAVTPFLFGFATSMSLIVAIGPQNAFVLRQGIRNEHVLPVVVLCVASDLVLIAAGIAGIGALVTAHPSVTTIVRYGGSAFLIGYGLLAARRAIRPATLTPSEAAPSRLSEVLLSGLALTLLNPHVYLDTVVLLGALANQRSDGRGLFGVGATVASTVWFVGLGFGARRPRRTVCQSGDVAVA